MLMSAIIEVELIVCWYFFCIELTPYIIFLLTIVIVIVKIATFMFFLTATKVQNFFY